MNYGMTKPPLGSVIDWSHPLSKGIVGCWLFNEGQGDIVNDISGNKNHGKLTNFSHPATTTSGWNPGKFGRGIQFDGSNDYINTSNIPIRTNPFTISLWFYANSSIVTGNLFAKEYGANYQFRCQYVSANKVIFIISNSNNTDSLYYGDYTLFTNKALYDKWHQLTITRQENKYTLFLNGVLEREAYTNTVIDHNNSYSLKIGRQGEQYLSYFKGLINNFLISNRALSSTEVQQLYTSPFCFIK